MDALLLALLGCLLIETGDKGQQLTLALTRRFSNDGIVIAGVLTAAFANAALSAAAGWYVSKLIGPDPRALFLGLALLFAGVGLLFIPKPPDALEGWRVGPFLTAFLGLFILGFGDGAQFLLAGVAGRTADPLLTAIGGGIGIAVAYIPVIMLRRPIFSGAGLNAVRRIAAMLFLIAGFTVALTAVGLI